MAELHVCLGCARPFPSSRALSAHQRACGREKKPCEVCGRPLADLERHRKKVHGLSEPQADPGPSPELLALQGKVQQLQDALAKERLLKRRWQKKHREASDRIVELEEAVGDLQGILDRSRTS